MKRMLNRLPVFSALLGATFSAMAQNPPPAEASPVLPPMQREHQFAGPLAETTIQRFRDPETGVLCYVYTPYRVPNGRNEQGLLVYGANNIGSISCVVAPPSGKPVPSKPKS